MKWDGYAFPAPEIRESDEHASHVASRVPHFGNETFSTGNMVTGFIDHLPSVSPADTSFACFIAGEGHGG